MKIQIKNKGEWYSRKREVMRGKEREGSFAEVMSCETGLEGPHTCECESQYEAKPKRRDGGDELEREREREREREEEKDGEREKIVVRESVEKGSIW
jgi:hypothetical protein